MSAAGESGDIRIPAVARSEELKTEGEMGDLLYLLLDFTWIIHTVNCAIYISASLPF